MNKNYMITFKELRQYRQLSAETTANALGVTKGTYQKYESSARIPSANVLVAMKEVYKCSYEEVMLALEFHITKNQYKNNPKLKGVKPWLNY